MDYKEFDWDNAREMSRNSRRVMWLEENFDKPITELEFVNAMRLLKPFSKSQNKRTKRNAYKPSHLRRDYRYLKTRFGFFTNQ